MAYRSLESLHCHGSFHPLTNLRTLNSHSLPSSLHLTPSKNQPLHLSARSLAIFAVSSATSTAPSTSQRGFSNLALLEQHLSAQNFRQADEETRRLLILLSGEAAQTRGYVFFSEVQFIKPEVLKSIDELWKKYSNNRFGYSVQRKIWKEKANMDFTKLFLKLGWMKKLDTEVEQFNYRSFPNEFIWELDESTPEGHLPLTNALRGIQLFTNILTHPAFDDEEEASQIKETVSPNPSASRIFKTDYSF